MPSWQKLFLKALSGFGIRILVTQNGRRPTPYGVHRNCQWTYLGKSTNWTDGGPEGPRSWPGPKWPGRRSPKGPRSPGLVTSRTRGHWHTGPLARRHGAGVPVDIPPDSEPETGAPASVESEADSEPPCGPGRLGEPPFYFNPGRDSDLARARCGTAPKGSSVETS